MNTPEELFKKILSETKLCVLATATLSGKPEAAVIEYATDSDYNLYFETFARYRKYSNLKSNPQTSVVITNLPNAIQMDGTVVELTGSESEGAKKMLIAKHGYGKGFYTDPEVLFFKFTPTWIRILVDADYPPKYSMIKK